MPTNTIRQYLEHIAELGLSHEVFIEDQALDIKITSPDFTEGRWLHERYGDTLLERGTGWELSASFRFTPDNLLDGIGEREGLLLQPYLTYRTWGYFWPDAGKRDGDLTIPEITRLLSVLLRGEFPHEFFEEDAGSL